MAKQEVIQKTLDLLETMEEGIVYVKEKLEQLNIEATITVMTDLITAFIEIEKSITPILEKQDNKIKEATYKLRNALDTMVKEYETTKGQKSVEIMQLNIEPAFKNWKKELEKTLRPYIVS
ncbi:hypothetical protein [Inediibacterium massiliense]|uniref:hypothetical protein n=1 Tax=Inediibacterium massiliense TaxID=1658111 RepID=UPI0006B56281|nr:hypothetical protein [Inediibacterium massiliense]